MVARRIGFKMESQGSIGMVRFLEPKESHGVSRQAMLAADGGGRSLKSRYEQRGLKCPTWKSGAQRLHQTELIFPVASDLVFTVPPAVILNVSS